MKARKPLYVTRPSLPPFEEYADLIKPLWESCQLTNRGPLSVEFERQLREYLGAKHVWLFSNGHMALELMIQGMGFAPGSEVITTPFTHASTTHAIVRNGLVPVLVDIERDGCGLDPLLAEAAVTERTCAILATHVYGFPCDVEGLAHVARNHGLRLLYDGAHAFGVRVGDVPIAGFGDATMFSTHATKVFQTVEGGIVAWEDDDLLGDLPQLVNFGLVGEEPQHVAPNARMNELEAAMGLCNLRRLDDGIGRRRRLYKRYVERLEGAEGVGVMVPSEGVRWNYAYMPVRLRDRNEAEARLRREGVFARRYFSPCVDQMRCYKGRFDGSKFPHAHNLAREVLCLPLFSSMELPDVDRVCSAFLRS